ncbi:hypothetical protein B0A48_18631 [Cryoendolithus antarcticus]|uniref:Uncharacterized protein n=1 Tax=Cryoendolithus antarcticus TaxID=1507870 RepID=A0A1V8S884_9PEZI|nr:hypothetical protein B0A48_18631 [Cryoendolithus antarcticus]
MSSETDQPPKISTTSSMQIRSQFKQQAREPPVEEETVTKLRRLVAHFYHVEPFLNDNDETEGGSANDDDNNDGDREGDDDDSDNGDEDEDEDDDDDDDDEDGETG